MADTKFNTGKVRFSYPHLLQKDQNDKYSVTLLIPKGDEKTIKKLAEACKQVYLDHKNDAFKGLEYEEVSKPYHDGDGRKPKGGAYDETYHGHWVLTAKSKNRVPMVDRSNNTISGNEEEMIYPGVWGRAAIGLGAFNTNGNRGICCFLNGVKSYGYGERFGKTFDARTGFDDGYEDPDEDDGDDLL